MKSLKKALAIFLASVMALGVMSVSAFAEVIDSVDGMPITFVDVTVEAPIDGNYASGNFVIDSEEYELADMMWTDAATDDILYSTNVDEEIVDAAFTEGSVYTVSIALYAADGYVFELNADELIVSVNGYVAEVEEISELGKLLIISCDFECSASDAGIDDGDDGASSITFDQILELLKTVLVTFIRFIGSLLGIK